MYDRYRSAPGWGTAGYKFASPLMPSYQPQPSWRGVDYYRAHGGYANPDAYNYAWTRVRDRAAVGFGKEEARLWHRRVYGGLTDIRTLMPEDIGAAAGYEAWRSWKYHHGVYAQPLAGDRERQREAIIGIAVAEAHRLWKYTGQRSDSIGRLKACEAAASTAVRILEHSFFSNNGGADGYYDDARGRTLSRRSSRSSIASFFSDVFSRSRSRSHSRHSAYGHGHGRRLSQSGSAYPIQLTSSVYSHSPTNVATYAAVDPAYARRRAYSNAAASPYLGSTPAMYNAPLVSSGGVGVGASTLSAAPYVPAYAGSGSGVTIIQPARRSSRSRSRSRHDDGRRHSNSAHRSSSSHRSSSRHRPHVSGHAHTSGYTGGGYYVSSGVPYGY